MALVQRVSGGTVGRGARSWPARYVTRGAARAELEQKVAHYEHVYEMSSADMLEALQRGERADTGEIATWMVWYQALKRLPA